MGEVPLFIVERFHPGKVFARPREDLCLLLEGSGLKGWG